MQESRCVRFGLTGEKIANEIGVIFGMGINIGEVRAEMTEIEE